RILAPTAGVWLRFTSLRNFEQDVPNYQTLWADTLTPNLMMPYDLRDAFGYEPVALKNAQTVDDKAAHAFGPKASRDDQREGAALAGALGVKYIAVCRVAPPEKTLPGLIAVRAASTLAPAGRKRGPQAKIYLSRNARWQPRARLEASDAPVTLTEAGPDQVTLTCATTAAARLILADTEAAGWQATVDGRSAPIESYGGSLRAVRLPGTGAYKVVFSYQPMSFRLGLYLSLLTLAGLMGAASFAVARNFMRGAGFGAADME
ncbi:MAG: YfhO family protein, partial [Armatimonadota bacterium]|nr:YfhO family protein [Armatimonadota bacterium]